MDSAFYSCVDDTIEDAFDASSDTEPTDSEMFAADLPSHSDLLDSEAKHVDVNTEHRTSFASRNCNMDADWSAKRQQQCLSNDDMTQGNFSGNYDNQKLPTADNFWHNQSSANSTCSLTACDNVPLNSNRSVTDIYHSELSRQRTCRFIKSSDSSTSQQPLLNSTPHQMESVKSHFQMTQAAVPSSTNRVPGTVFLPDDKVMEIVEEQLENDDDYDDDDDTEEEDDSYMVNTAPVLAVDDDIADSGDDSDADEVEEISEDDEDRLADEEKAVLEEAARAAAEAAATESASLSAATGECHHTDKTNTSTDDSVKNFPQATSDIQCE